MPKDAEAKECEKSEDGSHYMKAEGNASELTILVCQYCGHHEYVL